MTGYNYDAFSPDNYNLSSADGPEVGDKAPDFAKLMGADGKPHSLADLKEANVVVVCFSLLCVGKGCNEFYLDRSRQSQRLTRLDH